MQADGESKALTHSRFSLDGSTLPNAISASDSEELPDSSRESCLPAGVQVDNLELFHLQPTFHGVQYPEEKMQPTSPSPPSLPGGGFAESWQEQQPKCRTTSENDTHPQDWV